MSRAVLGGRACVLVLFVAVLSSTEQIGQCQRLTGIYVDNGMGQTVAHRVSSRRETRDIARDILDMLRLPAVPARAARFRNDSIESSGPASRYIQDVYRYTLNQDGAGLRFENAQVLKDSDVVVSYAAATTSNRADKEDILLQFDLSETPKEIESVIGARLRLHLGTREGNSVASVHAWMNLKNATSQQKQRQKRRIRLVDSVEVSDAVEGWIELDATEALRYWLSRGDKAASLRLSVAVAEGRSGKLLEEPFLVGYFKSGSRLQQAGVAAAVARRWKRSSGELWPYSRKAVYSKKPSSGQCLLHTLYVRFRELEFDRMIVAPDGYDAQFCAGECHFPLSDHHNATNHAIIQTLVHFLQPGRVPQACCVPTQLDPMTVIYSRDGRNHVLKRYHNMIIRGCGCH
ncbi:bone morphogenetic protein 7 [Nasonia vitripennis]|uniref:TGF-beta family profile domain-containing protein n=1 Tax=Nasonia vitripennis TaxID=7425 RepID=A0A7M7GDD2_NASVI|nr:bone morphogenetic protein 7 [Nasonia vitripennis]